MEAWILAAVITVALLWTVVIYNTLVEMKNNVRNAWKQIDVQLKRRHDLIPNLVTVVRGYMEFERETLERVTAARAGAIAAAGIRAKAEAEGILTKSLDRLFAVMENYPVLKSNENVMHLQEELATTENKIAFSRQLYNDLVAGYSTKKEIIPNNFIAGLFHFPEFEYYSSGESDRHLPRVTPGAGMK